MATQDELDRLSAILAAYPTTEAQDLRLLEGALHAQIIEAAR